MDLSQALTSCRVFTADISSHDLLPQDQPAVYAFYDLLRFDHTTLIDQIDHFKTRHGRHLRMSKSELPDSIRLHFRGNPTSFKGAGKSLCKKMTQPDAEGFSKTLMFLSFVNEPLYIGKTDSIRDRFYAHHDNGFLFSMKRDFKRPASEFAMFAYYCDKKWVRAIESVLIQLIDPPFCDQKT